MTGHLEFSSSRAELCRQLAEREPANRVLWVAEAENWSLLSQAKSRHQVGDSADSGISAGLLRSSARFLIHLGQTGDSAPALHHAKPGAEFVVVTTRMLRMIRRISA